MNLLYSFALSLSLITSIAALSFLQPKYILITTISAILSNLITKSLMPKMRYLMMQKNIFGYDLNKKGTQAGQKKIPQSQGLAAAISFCLICLILTPIISIYQSQHQLITHLTVLITIISTILLGFADDILDLQWRYKLLFPFFIIIPLISTYQGMTHFQVIWPFSILLGRTLDFGPLYLLYITCLGIYKTNTINIMAGINGLQVGQSIIATCGMLLYFFISNLIRGEGQKYIYSVMLLMIFLGGALILLKDNQYPAKIFIGDTFCYYAGIVLAIAAIYGQIPVVCHWFFIPQLINFLYSMPQLMGYVKCPRHRLARFQPKDGKLHAVKQHMNMLNLSLRMIGPTPEDTLCMKLLLFQCFFSLLPILHLLMFSPFE